MATYNAGMVLDIVVAQLKQAGRGGQTNLARAVGVRPQTVNKWMLRQTHPEPDKWEAIEDHFGLDHGTLRAASGLDSASDLPGRVERLEAAIGRMDALQAEVSRLRAALAEIDDHLRDRGGPSALR